jgi:hypothetical protein
MSVDMGVCEERTSDGGIAIVGAVTRKRIVTDREHKIVCSSELQSVEIAIVL